MEQFLQSKTNRWVIYVTLGALVLYLLAQTSLSLSQARFTVSPYSLPVTGKGEVVTIPDVATFSFTITEKAKKGEDAQAAMVAKANPTIDAVKAAGVAKEDIKTENYSLNPTYEYQNAPCSYGGSCGTNSVISGYEASETVTVKVRKLDDAGSIVALVGDKGVSNISSLSIVVDKPEAFRAQARELAIADAKAQAESIAKAAGLHLGRIISFNEDGSNPVMPYAMDSYAPMAMKSEAGAPVPIENGSQKITSNVTILFEIK